MKKTLLLLPALSVLAMGNSVKAATESFNFPGLNLAIPDGNPAGLANNQSISSTITSIDSVVLTLSISGTFNGDIYGYVTHASGLTILFNRPGKSSLRTFGYDGDGFTVTLDDDASNDIHTYQNQVTPGAGTPLTGTWQPDGRNVDPNGVLDTSPRTAMLNTFDTLAAGGDWTLFLADMSSGDIHALQSWSLTINGTVIPEPGTPLLALLAALVTTTRRRRRKP